MNYSITKHAFENRHFHGRIGGGTCYSPPRRIAPKPSVSGIAHGVGMTPACSMLSWGVGMHQAIVWVKAADHHGASGITLSSATGVLFFIPKVS